MEEQTEVESRSEAVAGQEISSPLLILMYLFGSDAIKGGPAEFPHYLNLGMFEHYMRQLDQQREIISQEVHPGSKVLKLEPFNIEGEAEVAKTIFYDTKTDSISATDTVHGNLSSVRSSFIDAYGTERMPLLEMHTHPKEALPSIADYKFMLLGNPKEEIRTIRAIAVLCPQTQILALATDHTPILTPDQVPKLITEWGEANKQYEGEEGRYLKTLANRVDRVQRYWVEAVKRSIERIKRKYEEDMKRIAQGLEPEETEEKSEDDYSQISEKVGRLLPKVSRKHADYLNKAFTKIQLQFVREMGIKLYTSTDFRNFVALPNQSTP